MTRRFVESAQNGMPVTVVMGWDKPLAVFS